MSYEETYNGWTNYATWLVVIHLENTESLYHWYRNQALEELHSHRSNTQKINHFANDIKRLMTNIRKNNINQLFANGADVIQSDLKRIDMKDVNWKEIAQAFLEDEKEEYERRNN